MAKYRTEESNGYKALFLNDDAAIFGFADNLDTFIEHDDDICTKLGIITKPEKSFTSQRGSVFCEVYVRDGIVDKKIGQLRRSYNVAEIAVNIVHAKQLFNSIKFEEEIFEFYRDKLVKKWGYEFHPSEVNMPFAAGGWWTPRVKGVRTDLLYLNDVYEYIPLKMI